MDAVLSPAKPSNFRFSFSFLPRNKRQAIERVYAFCHHTDDLADSNQVSNKLAMLAEWRREIEHCYIGTPSHPLLLRLKPVLSEFHIPKSYLLALVDGVEMDVTKSRYETFDELLGYCYHVASVVGLISLDIFGYKHPATKDYAVNLGYALQLTNILRDVGQDASIGRIYLPLEDLRRFNYSESDLLAHVYDERFIALMQFQYARALEYYRKAQASFSPDERATMFPAETMRAIYFRLLDNIERARFRVFDRRISVSAPYKLATAFRYWIGHNF